MQLAELESQLISHRDRLRKTLKNTEESFNSNSSVMSSDISDEASYNEQNEVTSQLASVESLRLNEIDEALARIKNGTYGICEDCEGKIAVARLEALPHATRCLKCQSVAEN